MSMRRAFRRRRDEPGSGSEHYQAVVDALGMYGGWPDARAQLLRLQLSASRFAEANLLLNECRAECAGDPYARPGLSVSLLVNVLRIPHPWPDARWTWLVDSGLIPASVTVETQFPAMREIVLSAFLRCGCEPSRIVQLDKELQTTLGDTSCCILYIRVLDRLLLVNQTMTTADLEPLARKHLSSYVNILASRCLGHMSSDELTHLLGSELTDPARYSQALDRATTMSPNHLLQLQFVCVLHHVAECLATKSSTDAPQMLEWWLEKLALVLERLPPMATRPKGFQRHMVVPFLFHCYLRDPQHGLAPPRSSKTKSHHTHPAGKAIVSAHPWLARCARTCLYDQLAGGTRAERLALPLYGVSLNKPATKSAKGVSPESKGVTSVGKWMSVGQVRIGAAKSRKAKHQADKAVKAAASVFAGRTKEPVLTPLMDFSRAVAQLTDLSLDVVNFLVLPYLPPANALTE
jgi:hypothetical protein